LVLDRRAGRTPCHTYNTAKALAAGGGRNMPIRGLLDVQEVAFDPEDIKVLTAAHETTLKQLKITDRKSAMAFLVAKTVIQVAKGGERNPQRLSERVIRVLQKPSL
jgi:hypothetical protein